MKVFLAAVAYAAALSTAFAAEFCDQWGQAKSGNYIIYNNLWGKADADAGGKQCTALNSGRGDTVSWQTSWTWTGGKVKVKSFANAALEFDPVQLTSVKSIPSKMEYEVSYTGTVVADVAYDLFTSSSATGDKEFEIMVWLAAIGGAGPISSTGTPITKTTIAGNKWSVYKGTNGQMTVYSFVAPKQVNSFDGDLMEFFNYLVKSQQFDTSQYLIKVECGTEPFEGTDVKMRVSAYSAVVNTGAGGTGTVPTTSSGGSSYQQTSTTGSSAETPATSTAGSSTGSSWNTPSTGSSEETPTGGSSAETPSTSSTGSSEETSSTGSSAETPATSDTGSSEETPATSTAGSSEDTPTTSSTGSSTGSSWNTPTTSSTGSSAESSSTGSSTGSTSSNPTTSTPGSSEETSSTGSSEDTPTTTAPTGQKCSRRRRMRA